jgi:hypothetical protein
VTRRPARTALPLLVATLVCVVVGALLHPATAGAAPRAATSALAPSLPGVSSGASSGLASGLSVPVTVGQAAAWHLPDSPAASTVRTPGGSTVVFTPASHSGQPQDFRWRMRWYGYYTVFFNKLETLRIAAGTAACAALVKHVPRVGGILATLCTLLSIIATYARARNQCVMVQGFGLLTPQILRYRGDYCR